MVPLHYRQRQWFQWFNANGVQKTEVFCTAQFGCTSTVRFLYTKTALLQRSLQAGTFNQPDSVCRQCLQGISFGRASLAYRFGVQKTEVFCTPRCFARLRHRNQFSVHPEWALHRVPGSKIYQPVGWRPSPMFTGVPEISVVCICCRTDQHLTGMGFCHNPLPIFLEKRSSWW
jgi:hypothetical protein